ncbi:TonB-dependent receptor [Shewanella putrefaciens]|uniref:TonB-dependent receptor n=2 Tax=Shewanellaceae TaxID=267890 RepID=A0ABX8XCU1_SHEPU|nr:TonB-dependent receptor [Shewanella putrefaciens]QYX73281.1 TonB-dependent receptor [Shewanella putrefaciens]GGN29855.1 TonB-dependent receptor [Shewanella putrefaciens]
MEDNKMAANSAYLSHAFNTSILYSSLAIALGIAPITQAMADDSEVANIEHIQVHGQQSEPRNILGSAENRLKEQGVDFSEAGGVSALPILNGMMGDRIKVLVDGADITASCANQMNPPLSYISANQITTAEVIAGVSPVSAGGDNIAGVIKVSSLNPKFGESEAIKWNSGDISTGYRSVSDTLLLGTNATVASKNVSLSYQGAYEDANSYKDGNGDKVIDTLYRAQNHALTAAWRDETQEVAIKLTHQNIPFQGFANQYMDMTDNKSYGALARYQLKLDDDGEFSAQVNWHGVKHEMGFFTPEKTGKMPMNTEGDDYSYQLHWRLPMGDDSTLLVGQEYYSYQLDDVWPAVPGTMMAPNDYININDGERRRAAVYGEWQQDLSQSWWLSAGIRFEYVTTNTGEVQAYSPSSMMGMPNVDAEAAKAFNAMDRSRDDNLIDATLLARYQLSTNQQLEFGLARKNRAPNLYERYSWGRGTMATTMIGWYGDGNGYVGNPDLKPETAHTLSAAYKYNDDSWQVSTTAWYTAVTDYVDAEVIGSFNRTNTPDGKRNILQFTNLDANLYGARFNALYQFAETSTGKWQVLGKVNVTRGERDEGDEPLYQIKPLQTELALQHQLGNWENSLSWQWVATKDRVDDRRLENETDSYSLLNLNSSMKWQDLTVTFAVNNLFDTYYALPLGGVSVAEFKADNTNGFNQVAGAGRSFELSASYAF